MASQKIHTVPHRRKRSNKTDYHARLSLLKSEKHRFVVRRSLKNLVVQVVDYSSEGDKVLFTVSTNHLKKNGWKGSTSNIPSAYLTGLAAGKMALEKGIKEGVFDIGLQRSTKGSRIYAALKGIVDAGVEIPHSDEILPSAERINGKHITEHTKNDISKEFEDIKKKIMA
jgi:large subunit ribosomal protein L18